MKAWGIIKMMGQSTLGWDYISANGVKMLSE